MTISEQPIGILTCRGSVEFKSCDHKIIKALASIGIKAEHLIWDEPSRDWSRYRAIVVLSTYDYCETEEHLDRFLSTLEAINACGITVLNSIQQIKWNCKKHYLKELEKQGIPTIETLWVTKDKINDLKSLIKNDWKKCVIKPVLSGGGRHTQEFAVEEVDRIATECKKLPVIEWMIQPFAPEILDVGEYSFIFIEKRFSHCVLKKPASGSFKASVNNGALDTPVNPPDWMRSQAQKIIDLFAKDNLFTRVDAIDRGKVLHVVEVEMIDPWLYREHRPAFEDQFANALIKRIG